MQLRYGTVAATPPNPCLECGERCRRPKRFCSDAHRELWFKGIGLVIDQRGTRQISEARLRAGITSEALEWRRKLNVARPF